MKKFITNNYTLYSIGFILFLLIWTVISLSIQERDLIFPDPLSTLKTTFELLKTSYVYKSLGASFLKMIIGFLISLALALIFGTIAGNIKYSEKIMAPTILILKTIPTASLVFLFLVLFNAKYTPIAIVALISFPILFESVLGGIKNIDKDILDALKMENCSEFRKLIKVKLPLAFPYILVGIFSSFALSFKIEIMAEVISGSTSYGLGSAISSAQKNNPADMAPIFAYSLIAIIFIILFSLITRLIANKLKIIDVKF
ncbi:MAG: ABC transporter permease subunit [Bacilli bacterium]|nr:ABC transporter permease subunit [Bacilli bacterium]